MIESIYSKRRAAGLCYACGKNPPADGKTRCLSCIQKSNEYINLVRTRRKRKGLCPNCGMPADEGSVMCKKCKAVIADRMKRYRKKKEAERNGGSDSETEEK